HSHGGCWWSRGHCARRDVPSDLLTGWQRQGIGRETDMSVSKFPPARKASLEVPKKGLLPFLTGPVDLAGDDVGRRVRLFAVARAVVFTCVGAMVIGLLAQSLHGFRFSYSNQLVVGAVLTAYLSAGIQWWTSR